MTTVGIDEVGRGSWAGPLVAGAVVLDDSLADSKMDEMKMRDSKALTKNQRDLANTSIREVALALGLGWVSTAEVDELGLTQAVRLAMRRALDQIKISFDAIIIDGNYNFLADDARARAVVKADATVPAVSAASIIAKFARDKWMAEHAAKKFPAYGFEKHVGYGTKLHREMLEIHGICELHRKSFAPIKKLIAES
jgi:ribonuclease HII